jgi:hypothetical protein
MRLKSLFVLAAAALVLNACGGGGGGGSSSPAPAPSAAVTPTPAACSAIATVATNAQTLCVGGGPTGEFTNVVMTSVTVCQPGTTNCVVIPNVQVDTGSSGLRLLRSELGGLATTLPAVTDAANANVPYGECGSFADGIVWGTLASADVKLAGETASNIPIQIILDNVTTPAVPADCSDQGTAEDSQTALGANGIIGVGLFLQDCGAACVSNSTFTLNNQLIAQYYDCPTNGTCTPAAIPLASQVPNPVSAFTQDNNGVILQIPAIPDTGVASAAATIFFGIGTESNNVLKGTLINATVTNDAAGVFTANYAGTSYADSFLDSGSSAYFVNTSSIPDCASGSPASAYLCPGATSSISLQQPSITVTSSNGASLATTVKIANANFLFAQANASSLFDFDDLGAPAGTTLPNAFDFGVPFFFGKTVFTGFQNGTYPYGYFSWE